MKITSGNRCHGMFYLAGMQVQLSHNCFDYSGFRVVRMIDRVRGESTMSHDVIQRESEARPKSSLDLPAEEHVLPLEKRGTRRLQNIHEIRDDWRLIQ